MVLFPQYQRQFSGFFVPTHRRDAQSFDFLDLAHPAAAGLKGNALAPKFNLRTQAQANFLIFLRALCPLKAGCPMGCPFSK
jgi:hypothetical protein